MKHFSCRCYTMHWMPSSMIQKDDSEVEEESKRESVNYQERKSFSNLFKLALHRCRIWENLSIDQYIYSKTWPLKSQKIRENKVKKSTKLDICSVRILFHSYKAVVVWCAHNERALPFFLSLCVFIVMSLCLCLCILMFPYLSICSCVSVWVCMYMCHYYFCFYVLFLCEIMSMSHIAWSREWKIPQAEVFHCYSIAEPNWPMQSPYYFSMDEVRHSLLSVELWNL